MRFLFRQLYALVALGVLVVSLCLLATAWNVAGYIAPQTPRADAIVVLGAASTASGSLGPQSRLRYETGRDLFAAGVAPVIVFTGSASTTAPPAQLMAVAAQADGLSLSSIVVEPNSHSTLQNALYTRDLIGPDVSILLVSHKYHLLRARASFWWAGFDDIEVYAADPDAFLSNRVGLFWEGIKWPINIVRATVYNLALAAGRNRDDLVWMLH